MSKYTQIYARVVDQTIHLASIPPLASGGMNEVQVRFTFCNKWDNLAKTAVFYKNPEQAYHVLLVDNAAVVPAEVLAEEGRFYFGVFGTNEEQVRTTEVVSLEAVRGAVTFQGIEPGEPTPDIYTQLMGAYGQLETDLAKERARLDELVAMRTTDGLSEYTFTQDGFRFYFRTNGVFTSFSVTAQEATIEAYGVKEFSCVPAFLEPLKEITLEFDTLEISLWPPEDNSEWLRVEIFNNSGSEFSGPIAAADYYELYTISIPELADARVGADGTIYPTAGAAMRGQVRDLQDRATRLEDVRDITIRYDDQAGDWRVESMGVSYQDLLNIYNARNLRTFRLINPADGYDCIATKIEVDEQGTFMKFHTAVGVFELNEFGNFDKIAEPDIVKSVNGATPDENGNVDIESDCYVVKVNRTGAVNNGTYVVVDFDWDKLCNAIVASKQVFCRVYDVTNFEDDGLTRLSDYVLSNFTEENYVDFDKEMVANENASRIRIYSNGTIEHTYNFVIPVTKKLLWENASPKSSFSAQTVTLDMTEYQEVEVDFVCFPSAVIGMTGAAAGDVRVSAKVTLEKKAFGSDIQYPLGFARSYSPTASVKAFVRQFYYNGAGIQFLVAYAEGTTTTSAAHLVPYRIYGLKGVTRV